MVQHLRKNSLMNSWKYISRITGKFRDVEMLLLVNNIHLNDNRSGVK